MVNNFIGTLELFVLDTQFYAAGCNCKVLCTIYLFVSVFVFKYVTYNSCICSPGLIICDYDIVPFRYISKQTKMFIIFS